MKHGISWRRQGDIGNSMLLQMKVHPLLIGYFVSLLSALCRSHNRSEICDRTVASRQLHVANM